MTLVPTRAQVAIEQVILFCEGIFAQAFGSKEAARKFLPLLMTLFIFIVVANQFSLVPLVSQIVLGEKSLIRLPTSDLSQTVMLSLMVVIVSHVIAFRMAPLKHLGSYIRIGAVLKIRSPKDVGTAILELFLGMLDIAGELAKVISLACRLFGNIFAGEVMVAVIIGLSVYTSYIVPIPFMLLSLFSGFVQAFVFMLLATQFIATTYKTYAVRS